MTMESDANFEEKQTFGFEKDIRNLLNFYQSFKIGTLMRSFFQSRD